MYATEILKYTKRFIILEQPEHEYCNEVTETWISYSLEFNQKYHLRAWLLQLIIMKWTFVVYLDFIIIASLEIVTFLY